MFETVISLPDTWIKIKLEEISEKINPGFPSGKWKRDGDGGVPHLRPMNITKHGDIDLENLKYAFKNGYDSLKKHDVLLNNTNSPALLGKTAYIKRDTDWAYSNHMTRIRFNNSLVYSPFFGYHLHYLYYNGYYRMNCRHHVNQASVNSTFLRNMDVPLPPYNEQVRIISKIEELFSQLDQGVKALQETQIKISQYRQSSFNLLVTDDEKYHKESIGRLLFLSKERFKPLESASLSYIGLADIERDTGKILNIGKSDETKSLKSIFHSGDVLYGRLRPYLNKVTVPDFSGVCSTDILVFNTSEKIDPYYLQYVLMSNNFVSYTTNNMSGVQHPRVKFDIISKYKIPLPPIQKQKQLRLKYEEMLSRMQYLESNIKNTISKCDLFKQSILKQSFSGNLVPQDPDDEPASVLLERIKAEKAKLKPIRVRGRRRQGQGDMTFQMTPVRKEDFRREGMELF